MIEELTKEKRLEQWRLYAQGKGEKPLFFSKNESTQKEVAHIFCENMPKEGYDIFDKEEIRKLVNGKYVAERVCRPGRGMQSM